MKKDHLRNESVDIAKGIAVAIMIVANFSRDLLTSEDISFLHRFISSLAAPVFYYYSGYLNLSNKSVVPNKIPRFVWILISAILVDLLVWNIFPLNNFDTLYGLAFCIIIIKFLRFINIPLFFAFLFVLFFSIILHYLFQYRFQINELTLLEFFKNPNDYSLPNVFFRLFFDGWFPIFPWCAFSILGAHVREKGFSEFDYIKNPLQIFIFTTCSLVFTVILIYFFTKIPALRDGYVELFYPFNILLFFTMIIWIFWLDITSKTLLRSVKFLKILGKYALFAYIFHTCISSFIFKFSENNFGYFQFLIVCFFYLVVLVKIVRIIDKSKDLTFFRMLPSSIKYITGLK